MHLSFEQFSFILGRCVALRLCILDAEISLVNVLKLRVTEGSRKDQG